MKTRGSVTAVQHTIKTQGGGDHHLKVSYIALFRVDGQQCRMRTNEPLPLADNDVVAISGRKKQDTCEVLAIRNFTSNMTTHVEYTGEIILAICTLIVGLFLSFLSLSVVGGYAVFILGFFIFFACYHWNRTNSIKSALVDVADG